MVSHIAIAAAEGFKPKTKPRRIDEIAQNSQPKSESEQVPNNYGGDTRRFRASIAPQSPRGPPDDDLEERIGPKLVFSIAELAELADRSQATIFRLLRLGLLPSIRIGGYRRFTRATVLDFLRYGTSDQLRRSA
jgi:excisionase family DNA binding protein